MLITIYIATSSPSTLRASRSRPRIMHPEKLRKLCVDNGLPSEGLRTLAQGQEADRTAIEELHLGCGGLNVMVSMVPIGFYPI